MPVFFSIPAPKKKKDQYLLSTWGRPPVSMLKRTGGGSMIVKWRCVCVCGGESLCCFMPLSFETMEPSVNMTSTCNSFLTIVLLLWWSPNVYTVTECLRSVTEFKMFQMPTKKKDVNDVLISKQNTQGANHLRANMSTMKTGAVW